MPELYLASLGLEFVELYPCACDHAMEIGCQHHHVESSLNCARCKFRTGTMHDGLYAGLVGSVADLVAGGEM
ncbi:MAG: hypothetical protein ACI8PT_004898, partial [Gammaproteobacteria bacterium]